MLVLKPLTKGGQHNYSAATNKKKHRGMQAIETGDPTKFKSYLRDTKNTICGRHPIAVLMWALKHSGAEIDIRSVHYEQSSQCVTKRDSSVSYAVLAATNKA